MHGDRIASHKRELRRAAEQRELRKAQRLAEATAAPVPESVSKEMPVEQLVEVPSQLIGALIGKGGENIKQLSASTGFSPQPFGS